MKSEGLPALHPHVANLGTQTRPHSPLQLPLTAHSLCRPSLSTPSIHLPCSEPSTSPINPKGRSAYAALRKTTRGCGSACNREAIYLWRISADWLESWLHAPWSEASPALWAISPWPALPHSFSRAPCASAHQKIKCTNRHPHSHQNHPLLNTFITALFLSSC